MDVWTLCGIIGGSIGVLPLLAAIWATYLDSKQKRKGN